MRDAARDSYLLMAATAQTKWVRWQAIINLMELASFDGQETAFDDYTSELRREPLPPLLKSHFLLMLGEGLERFDRYETAAQALSEAKSCADHNQIFSVSFKADEALSALRSRTRKAGTQPTFAPLPHDVLAAAHDISELRKAAVATG
jgi:hypothetical protein